MRKSICRSLTIAASLIYTYFVAIIIQQTRTFVDSKLLFMANELPGHIMLWRLFLYPLVCFVLAIPIGFILMNQFDLSDLFKRFRISKGWLLLSLLPLLLQMIVYIPVENYSEVFSIIYKLSIYYPTIPVINGTLSGFFLAKGLFKLPSD